MKRLLYAATALFLTVGAVSAQQITVQGEKKANIDFKKYKTFGWLKDESTDKLVQYTYDEIGVPVDKKGNPKPNEVVVYSYSFYLPSPDSGVNKAIKKSVDSELEGRGYRKDMSNPDLLVAYRVFDKTSKIKAFNNDPTKVNSGETYTPSDTMTYALKPGSVYISLLDAKTSEVIWEGSATGIAKSSDAITEKMKIKEAINLIFKKYSFRGDKYSMN